MNQTRVSTIIALVMVSIGILLPCSAGATKVTGKHATNFHILHAGTGNTVRFYNYDFGYPGPHSARRNNVDWAIDLIFIGNASVPMIEHSLSSFYPYGKPYASPAYGRINDGSGWLWASDPGRKTAMQSCGTRDDHYRLYADPHKGKVNYAVGLGFFVVGSMHQDMDEFVHHCSTPATFGYSELAERHMQTNATAVGWDVHADNYNMDNLQGWPDPIQEGDHIWYNNGLATTIQISG